MDKDLKTTSGSPEPQPQPKKSNTALIIIIVIIAVICCCCISIVAAVWFLGDKFVEFILPYIQPYLDQIGVVIPTP